jgi:Ser/Thr protein kinase RdoA (MazF antagonist)
VLQAEASGGAPVVVKVFERRGDWERELEVGEALSVTDAPVPRLTGAREIGDCWILMFECIHGNTIDRPTPTILDEVGVAVSRLHMSLDRCTLAQMRFWRRAGFEELSEWAWSEYLGGQLRKWRSQLVARPDDLDGGLHEFAEGLQRALRHLEEPRDLAILHRDLSFRNMMVDSRGVQIFDFGAALIGDGRYDLAKMFWTDLDANDQATHQRLTEAWSRHSGIGYPPELQTLYGSIQAIAAVAWVDRQEQPDVHVEYRREALEALAVYRSLF